MSLVKGRIELVHRCAVLGQLAADLSCQVQSGMNIDIEARKKILSAILSLYFRTPKFMESHQLSLLKYVDILRHHK